MFLGIAFKLPNLVRKLTGEGALLPVALSVLKEEETENNTYISWLFIVNLFITVFLSVIFFAFADKIIYYFSFKKVNLTYQELLWVKFTFLYVIFISLAVVFWVYLYKKQKFFPTTFNQVIFNFTFICFILLSGIKENFNFVILGVLVAGFFQMLYSYWEAKKSGFKFLIKKSKKIYEKIKETLKKLFFAIFATTANHINSLVDSVIAWQFVSANALLYFANRIVQLPIAVIGFGLVAVNISKFKIEDLNKVNKILLEKSLILLITAFLLGITVKYWLGLILGYGKLKNSIDKIVNVIYAYLPLVIFVPLNRFLSNVNFFIDKEKINVYITIISVISNIILSITLSKYYKVIGIAAATSIATILTFFLYYINFLFNYKKRKKLYN